MCHSSKTLSGWVRNWLVDQPQKPCHEGSCANDSHNLQTECLPAGQDTHSWKHKLSFNQNLYLLVNLEPENGETGLHLAACKNNEKMISFLLDLGASPNMVDLKGRSPAMRAAEFGHVQALTLLTDADTDLTSKEFYIFV